MFRRVLLATGVLALVVGTSAAMGSGVAVAMSAPISYSGTITCTVTGTDKFSPGLTNGGSAAATVSVKAKLKSCTDAADSGVTITKGTLTVTSSPNTTTANCGPVLAGEALPTLNGEIKWKASGGKVDDSTVVITSPSVDYDVDGNSISTNLPTSVSGGSDSSDTASFSGLGSDKSGYYLDSTCSGTKGLGHIAFGKSSGSVTGTVTIASGS